MICILCASHIIHRFPYPRLMSGTGTYGVSAGPCAEECATWTGPAWRRVRGRGLNSLT